jgi:hypothetical protein
MTEDPNKAIADSIISFVGPLRAEASEIQQSDYEAGEFQLAAIISLDFALEKNIAVPRELVEFAVRNWAGFLADDRSHLAIPDLPIDQI